MERKPENLRELIEQRYASVAKLPAKNDFSIDKLDSLLGYTVPLVSRDYSAKTPIMWNTLYEKLGLNIRNIMLVANPVNANVIIPALKNDPKYLGGGFGVGWKEKLNYLDEIRPADLGAVNIVVKEQGKLIGYNTDAAGFVKSLEDKFTEIGKKIKGSNMVIFGAGGVAKEVARLLAEKKANRIAILNRTYSKAVAIAYELNQEYGQIATGGGEDMIRGCLLNSFVVPDAAINLSDKGSDGPLKEFSAFAVADTNHENGKGFNNSISRTIARDLFNLNPNIIIADIVLPKEGVSITLRIAKNEGLTNLIDGIPMVVYQAVPAYDKIQQASPDKHLSKANQEEIFNVFKQAAGL